MKLRAWYIACLQILLIAGGAAFQTSDVALRSDRLDAKERSLLNRRAFLVLRDATLSTALARLSETSGVPVAFSPSLAAREPRLLDCDCRAMTVRQALDLLVEGTSFDYRELRGEVLVFWNAVPAMVASSPRYTLAVAQPIGSIRPAESMPHPMPYLGQDTAVAGIVVNAATGQPLQDAQVSVVGADRGAITDAAGRFRIDGVARGDVTLQVQLIGYRSVTQTVQADEADVRIMLEQRAISLEEIVATGVAAETPQNQLAFTVEKLNVSEIQHVPTPSVSGLVQGKIPGVKVVQGSGLPGAEPSFQFRGPTSISGSQEPLIVIDGVITAGGIADLNTQDIESIEVVKGAAAAALYGSRAQAGVLQVTTKQGAATSGNGPEFTVRTSFEANSVERSLGFNRSHPWRLNEAGTEFVDRDGNVVTLPTEGGALAFDDGGSGTVGERTFSDKAFPGQTFDPLGQFFNPGDRLTNNVSVSGNQDGTRYFLSAGYTREEGAITLVPPMEQWNLRLNLAQPFGDNFQLAVTSFLADRKRSLLDEQGGLLRQLTFVTAAADLMKIDPETGEISHIGDPIDIANVSANPINRLVNTDDQENRTRFTGGFNASYSPIPWLTFDANVSYDRIDSRRDRFERPGLLTLSGPPTVGSILHEESLREELNASVTAGITRQFGDLTFRNRARWLVESQDWSEFSASGSGLPVDQVPRLGIVTGTPEIDSFKRRIRSEGAFFINSFIYRDRYVTDFLVRRDGSSLFGADQHWQSYWRFSAAWRISQEPWFNFAWLNEFKPRYSIGTSGGRPPFQAQFQTYQIDRGQLVARTLGNSDLRPELATEQEFGLDMVIGQRVRIEVNYVDTKVEDQLLLVPLPSVRGFESQWRNAGTLESNTWELSLEAAIVERPGLSWTARLNLDATRNEIAELNIPPFRGHESRLLAIEDARRGRRDARLLLRVQVSE